MKKIDYAKRMITVFVLSVLVTITMTPLLLRPVYADFALYYVPKTMLKMVTNSVIGPFNAILCTTDDKNNPGLVEMGKAMNKVVFEDSTNIIGKLSTYFWLAAIVIMVIAAALKIFENVQRTQADVTTEVLKGFYKICFSGFIMTLAPKIVGDKDNGLIGLAEMINSEVGKISTVTDLSDKVNLKTLCGSETPDFLTSIGLIFVLILPWMLSILMMIAAIKMALSILLEIGIRRMLFPLCTADIYIEGIHSTGFRYIKLLFGSVLKISVVIGICLIANSMINSVVSSVTIAGEGEDYMKGCLTFLILDLAVNFTVLGIIKRSGDFINDALGA